MRCTLRLKECSMSITKLQQRYTLYTNLALRNLFHNRHLITKSITAFDWWMDHPTWSCILSRLIGYMSLTQIHTIAYNKGIIIVSIPTQSLFSQSNRSVTFEPSETFRIESPH